MGDLHGSHHYNVNGVWRGYKNTSTWPAVSCCPYSSIKQLPPPSPQYSPIARCSQVIRKWRSQHSDMPFAVTWRLREGNCSITLLLAGSCDGSRAPHGPRLWAMLVAGDADPWWPCGAVVPPTTRSRHTCASLTHLSRYSPSVPATQWRPFSKTLKSSQNMCFRGNVVDLLYYNRKIHYN